MREKLYDRSYENITQRVPNVSQEKFQKISWRKFYKIAENVPVEIL